MKCDLQKEEFDSTNEGSNHESSKSANSSQGNYEDENVDMGDNKSIKSVDINKEKV